MINNYMKHFIYKTTHTNGKFYIGRHSTTNIDDGYIGSGKWPKSIKDKSTLTREILEYADNITDLVEAETNYLNTHCGKPQCMNISNTSTGAPTGNANPMRCQDIANKISGSNHWTRRTPEKILYGDNHWMNKNPDAKYNFIKNNPNLDGRNSILATSRGNNIFQTNNPSIWRSEAGIHHWQNGNSPNTDGKLNKQLVEAGTHNFLGPDANNKRIEEGTHNFMGSDSNLKMLASGTHPSQQKAKCVHCGKTVSIGMHKRWHGDNCKLK